MLCLVLLVFQIEFYLFHTFHLLSQLVLSLFMFLNEYKGSVGVADWKVTKTLASVFGSMERKFNGAKLPFSCCFWHSLILAPFYSQWPFLWIRQVQRVFLLILCAFSVDVLAYVVSCFVLRYPFRQNQLTTYVYSAMGGSRFRDTYIKSAFRAQNTSKHTLILYTWSRDWWSMRWQKTCYHIIKLTFKTSTSKPCKNVQPAHRKWRWNHKRTPSNPGYNWVTTRSFTN